MVGHRTLYRISFAVEAHSHAHKRVTGRAISLKPHPFNDGRAHLVPLHAQFLHLPRDAGEAIRLRVVRLAEPPLAVDAQLEELRACVAAQLLASARGCEHIANGA